MNVGDKIPVTIAGQTVAMAEVKELAEGTATLIVPATRVVMATKTELTVEAPTQGGGVQVIGTEEKPEQPFSAPVADPAQNDATPGQVTNDGAQSAEVAQPEAPVAATPAQTTPLEVEQPTQQPVAESTE